jgi:hypothetical protein
MLIDVAQVKALPDFKLWLKFEDGVEGTVAFKDIAAFRGVFSQLENPTEFFKVSVNPELGVVCWPNGADLDSEVLYSLVSGKPITLNDGTVVSPECDPAHV